MSAHNDRIIERIKGVPGKEDDGSLPGNPIGPAHTPGPWRIDMQAWQPWTKAIPIRAGVEHICWTASYGNEEADARLIAAAPEMLAALKAVAATDHGAGAKHWAACDLARAAIAKAEGRS